MVGGFKDKSNISAKIASIVCEKAVRDDFALKTVKTNVMQAYFMNESLERLQQVKEWDECGTLVQERLTNECELKYKNNIINILNEY